MSLNTQNFFQEHLLWGEKNKVNCSNSSIVDSRSRKFTFKMTNVSKDMYSVSVFFQLYLYHSIALCYLVYLCFPLYAEHEHHRFLTSQLGQHSEAAEHAAECSARHGCEESVDGDGGDEAG